MKNYTENLVVSSEIQIFAPRFKKREIRAIFHSGFGKFSKI